MVTKVSGTIQGGGGVIAHTISGNAIVQNGQISPSTTEEGNSNLPSDNNLTTSSYGVFISFASENVALAEFFGEFIQAHFTTLGSCFVSSRLQNISAGQNWVDTLTRALKSTKLLLVIANKYAMSKSWLHFEIGAAWARGIPIIFLCDHTLSPDDLPLPYNTRQALSLHSAAGKQDLEGIISHIEHTLKIQATSRYVAPWAMQLNKLLE